MECCLGKNFKVCIKCKIVIDIDYKINDKCPSCFIKMVTISLSKTENNKFLSKL